MTVWEGEIGGATAVRQDDGPLFSMLEKNTAEKTNELESAARTWIDENPMAMQLLERFALQAACAGRRFGMKALWERARWEAEVVIQGDAQFRLNNNHTAYVARELIKRHAHLADYIELRKIREAS